MQTPSIHLLFTHSLIGSDAFPNDEKGEEGDLAQAAALQHEGRKEI